jgi:hypothetical protein
VVGDKTVRRRLSQTTNALESGIMATYQAIAATSNTVLKLLENAWRAEKKPAGIEPKFELYYKPGNFETPTDEGITLYRCLIQGQAGRDPNDKKK